MNMRTLFLARRDKDQGCQWFPIGQLDADVDVVRPIHRFRNAGDTKRAEKKIEFPLLVESPQDYQSSEHLAKS